MIELIGLTPLVVLLTFGTVQVALWMYEKQLVTAAAQEAAHAAAAADLTPTQASPVGEAAAARFLGGDDTVTVQTITVERGADAAEASITATGLSMIPGLDLQVTGVARSSIEQFVGPP
ncbi:TadE/TadG family type IV pilus assembly protein [Aquipuribacter sp. MA13-13]|uniref:TadE/TadG family type IV pilus assembly protein n=1 Tax=Aquipuribacter sp. MA13-13 TaxID=3440840 RepID=UPI003EF04B59